jgi:hypothetical protein
VFLTRFERPAFGGSPAAHFLFNFIFFSMAQGNAQLIIAAFAAITVLFVAVSLSE